MSLLYRRSLSARLRPSIRSCRRGRADSSGLRSSNWPGIKTDPAEFVVMVASFASVLALLGVLLGFANGTSLLWGVAVRAPCPDRREGDADRSNISTPREVRRSGRRHRAAHRRWPPCGPRAQSHGRCRCERCGGTDRVEELARVVNEIAPRSKSGRLARSHGPAHAERGLRMGRAGGRDQPGDGRQSRGGARSGRQDHPRAQRDPPPGEGTQRRGSALGRSFSSRSRSWSSSSSRSCSPTYIGVFFNTIIGIAALDRLGHPPHRRCDLGCLRRESEVLRWTCPGSSTSRSA